MKPGAKMKSKKKCTDRRGKKNKARERKTLAAASTFPHNGTLADWVAGMKAMGEKDRLSRKYPCRLGARRVVDRPDVRRMVR